jgi:spermidine dehydrogenase
MSLRLICEADPPAEEFDLVAWAFSKQGDGELVREMLQTGHERLVIGGRMVAAIDNPGGTYAASLDFPVSLDGYKFSADPSKPVCLHLVHTPCAPNQGLNMREQYRAGRTRLYTMNFGDFEREIRDELGRMLGSAGFDFDRDVAAITVNRWPHGYAYTPTPLYDDPAHQASIAKLARRRLGRIAIANSDSGWDAYTHVAIDQAHRAVAELTG